MRKEGSFSCTTLIFVSLTAVTIQIVGLTLFVFGFFPIKPALSGFSGSESYIIPNVSDSNWEEFGNGFDIADNLAAKQIKSMFQKLSGIPSSFDRLVFMVLFVGSCGTLIEDLSRTFAAQVIDGLPAEFVLGNEEKPPPPKLKDSIPFTHALLRSGKAIGFHSIAAPPTVTMPRLKAMMSGSIGGFLDVAMNFNTQAMLDDNLLVQLLRIGWEMVMLGDETWIKLFPGFFKRHDGVNSFFVKDTVQVDQNVTRHLDRELNQDDWDLLILHYLGVDHIGHVGGRDSDLMAPKLREMDEIVERIYSNLIEAQVDNLVKSTLLVIVSDHGMTEAGNHGGSSYPEKDSLAIFVGLPTIYESGASYRTIHQVDIAPTLALLLGVPIPKNNIGVLIPEIFRHLTDDKFLRALETNTWQLFRLLRAQFLSLHGQSFLRYCMSSTNHECNHPPEKKLCCLYTSAIRHSKEQLNNLLSHHINSQNASTAAHQNFLATASEWLSRRITDKPFSLLAGGLLALILSSLLLIILTIQVDKKFGNNSKTLKRSKVVFIRWHLEEVFVLFVAFAASFGMGSSSLVEEEHYIWHFMLATCYLLLFRKVVLFDFPIMNKKDERGKAFHFQLFSLLMLLLIGRILRGWHQGGVNWTHLPDISKWLDHADPTIVKLLQRGSCFLVIILGICVLAKSNMKSKAVQLVSLLVSVSGLTVFWYIISYHEATFVSESPTNISHLNVTYAYICISVVVSLLFVPWLCDKEDYCVLPHYLIGLVYILCWCFLQLVLQQRVNSIPLFLLILQVIITVSLYSGDACQIKDWVYVSLLYYSGMAGHFALGNSNTLATINVAGAFIGLSRHSSLISGVLMFFITYASPMLVFLSLMMFISVKARNGISLGCLGLPCLVPVALNSVLLTSYTVVLLLMRNHLFVWSVFSPKYMYVCGMTACVYVGLFVVICTEAYVSWVFSTRKSLRDS